MKKIYSFLLMATMLLIGGNAWADATQITKAMVEDSPVVDGAYVVTLGNGDFTTYGISENTFKGMKIVFKGNGATTWKYGKNSGPSAAAGSDGGGCSDYSLGGAHVTFKNLTLQDNYDENNYYRGFVRCASMTFENCTIKNMMGYLGVGDVHFVGCTFDVVNVCEYAIKTYSGKDFYFEKCTFNCQNKGVIQAYMQDNSTTVHNILVKDCKFEKKGSTTSRTPIYFYDQGATEGARWAINLDGNENVDGKISANATSGSWLWGDMKYATSATAIVVEDNVVVWQNNSKAAPVNVVVLKSVEDEIPEGDKDYIANVNNSEVVSSGSLSVVLIDVETDNDALIKLTFEVTPKDAQGTPVNNLENEITFKLPVPASIAAVGEDVIVKHNDEVMTGTFTVQEGNYVTVSSKTFSPFSIEKAPAGPDFTQAEIIITNADELVALSAYVNAGNTMSGKTVKLANDIDMSSVDNFTPIGKNGATFNGTFDGQDHSISNLTIITSDSYIGLFGYVDAATIKNVKLVKANISGKKRVGALIGQIAGAATVENCSTDATSVVTGSDSNTGGLIGEAAGNFTCTLKGLTNNATVTNTESSVYSRAAGIICQATTKAKVIIEGCVNNGAITSSNYTGGVVSAMQGEANVRFKDCSNTGVLTGTHAVSMLAWINNGGVLELNNCGDADNALGLVANDNYAYKFIINGVEYFFHTGAAAVEFSALWDDIQYFNDVKMKAISDFFAYAKTVNSNFAGYATDYYGIFTSAWSVDGAAYNKMKTILFNKDQTSGWPQLLSQFNAAKGTSVTSDDFEVTWTYGKLYTLPVYETVRSGLTVGKFGTYCGKADVTMFRGAKFYYLSGFSDASVQLTEVTSLKAGYPYVFEAEAAAVEMAQHELANETATEALSYNGLIGCFADNTRLAEGMYILSNNKLYMTGANNFVDNGRAYFNLNVIETVNVGPGESVSSPVAARRVINVANVATSVENNAAAVENQKVVINGQVVILRDGKMFNVLGAELK